MNLVVECELEIRLVLSPEHSLPVQARLTYLAEDPYAAHIAFHVGSGTPVTWTFARELLVEGVFPGLRPRCPRAPRAKSWAWTVR